LAFVAVFTVLGYYLGLVSQLREGGNEAAPGIFDLKFFLEDHLGQRVDLVTPDALKTRLRPVMEREAVDVA
jgi:predicted nucleotidyltransferase